MSAFFSGMEIAFLSSNKLRIELDRKRGLITAKILSFFIRKPGEYLVTMLIGNNIALVIYGLLMAMVLEPVIMRFTQSGIWILLIQTIISTLFILVTAEFIPKAVFRINPNLFLNIFIFPVVLTYVVLYPVVRFTSFVSKVILKVFLKTNVGHNERLKAFSKVDLDNLVNDLESNPAHDLDDETEIKIFQNALDFSKVKLRDCMIPRTEIVAIDKTGSMEELTRKFSESGYSKILVYENNIDHIIGYISSKDLFKCPPDLESIMIKPVFVPETMPARKLLSSLLQKHKSIAVVVDEFGGTAGLITIEDILEEIFGEIEDEHDTPDLIEKQINENEYILSGRLEVDYLNEKYHLGIPESDEYETLAGFILYFFQSLPKTNEVLQIDPYILKILKMNNTRVELVHMKRKIKA